MAAPAWSRLLYRLSRTLDSVNVAQQIVRDELLFAFLHSNARNALTFQVYAKNRNYFDGGEIFVKGLFAWEVSLLSDPHVPRSGRVLLGAAGGGRELQSLLARGYEVYAFEPASGLVESAQTVARGKNAVVVKAAYDDLVTRASGEAGPLDSYGGMSDLCILGWGSLSHLTEPKAVLELLRAIHTLSPRAPILMSFFLRSDATVPLAGGARRLRRSLRRLFERAGSSVPPGLKFQIPHGFYYEFSRSELWGLCAEAGYEVARFDELPYPHALLLPKESSEVASPV